MRAGALLALASAALGIRIPVDMRGLDRTGASTGVVHYPQERHLANVRQLTFGGSNAEAYFSNDARFIVFQAANTFGALCDQIFRFNLSLGDMSVNQPESVSKLMGTTTCSYFYPFDDDYIMYASTYDGTPNTTHCIPKGVKKCGGPSETGDGSIMDLCNTTYTWDIFPQFDIYTRDMARPYAPPGRLVANPNIYDAEATVSPTKDKIVYTSMLSGDLELWTMDLDGNNRKQVTTKLGYDGGAFFAPDGVRLVYRASRPTGNASIAKYRELLLNDLVSPTEMELFLINADGTNETQLTNLGGANWAPFFHPNNHDIIFSTNHHSPGFNFNLFEIYDNGTCREQITFDPVFDAFPFFSPDGTKLIFASMRNQSSPHEINLFLADWVPGTRVCLPPVTTPHPNPSTPPTSSPNNASPPLGFLLPLLLPVLAFLFL